MKPLMMRMLYSLVVGAAFIAGWVTFDAYKQTKIPANQLTIEQIANLGDKFLTLHIHDIPITESRVVVLHASFKGVPVDTIDNTDHTFETLLKVFRVDIKNPNIDFDVTNLFSDVLQRTKTMHEVAFAAATITTNFDESKVVYMLFKDAYFTIDSTRTLPLTDQIAKDKNNVPIP
jgi:hypothetical protein